jgi:hypothetical protein
MKQQATLSKSRTFLYTLIQEMADEKALAWLEKQTEKVEAEGIGPRFYLSFSMTSRYFRKELLQLSAKNIQTADELRKGFQLGHWNLLQTVRSYLLLLLPPQDKAAYLASLDKLFDTAEMDEQVALYGALPLLAYPEALVQRAREGTRTNMTTVFDSIALQNPYPADYLPEAAWNQMVLKAVFMQRPLYKIYGADERANAELAGMLIDFAHERRAAGRKVMPELWRFVGPYLDEQSLPDMEKTVAQGEPLEKEACLLACSQSSSPAAKQLLRQYPHFRKWEGKEQESWQAIGEGTSGM